MEKKFSIEGLVKVDLIKNYIKENKLSQKEFAKICGINIWNLRAVLCGHVDFDVMYLVKIARVMNLRLSDMFNDF